MQQKFIPHDYQKKAIDHILANEQAGLFLEMGLGKTVSTLTAIEQLRYDRFEIGKVLLIAPKRVVQDTWPDEIDKWAHVNHLKMSVVLGTPKQRREALATQADIYAINRENVVWLVEELGKDWPFDTLIIDELSSFKSSKSKRFRALRKVRPYFKRVIGLTGTPAPKGLYDLWSQLYLLDSGERLGKTLTSYQNAYFRPGRVDPARHIVYEWVPRGQEAEEAIYDKIGDICLSMKTVDYLTLPDRIDNVVQIELPPKERKLYEKLEKEQLLEFDDQDVIADNAAALTNKLLQLSNGAIYDEDGGVVHVHDRKTDELKEIVEEMQGQPVLVFYSFRHDLDRLKKAFPKAEELDKPDSVKRWNAGEIPMLLAHPASAGHGLNLQHGGQVIVWYGLTWSLELYQQANARLHRQGQKSSVIIHHLLTKDSIDERVLKSLQDKEMTQEALFEAIKERMQVYSCL